MASVGIVVESLDETLARLRTWGAVVDGGEKTEEWHVHPLSHVRFSRDML